MTSHFSILAWGIQWTEKPGRLQSMGYQGVGHDFTTKTYINLNKEVKTWTQKTMTLMTETEENTNK